MTRAAPKLGNERARAILSYAIEQRDRGALFVTVMASELEALAQEVLDARTVRELETPKERDARGRRVLEQLREGRPVTGRALLERADAARGRLKMQGRK